MERPLKERLIGAAVLVAAAIILVPEMLSGPKKPSPRAAAEPGAATATKTYTVDLRQPSSKPAIASPAEEPQAPAESEAGTEAESSSEPTSEPESPVPQEPAPETSQEPPPASPDPPKSEPSSQFSAPAPVASGPPPANPIASPPKKGLASGKWAVQVGSFASPATANGLAQRLEKQGYDAFVRSVNVKGKQLYRVRVGPMADRSAAEAVLTKLKPQQPSASVVPQ